MSNNQVGSVVWTDLTVKDAHKLKDFYQAVIGWQSKAFDMGDYDDFVMQLPEGNKDEVGICHARGGNADLPAQWLVYFQVANLDESIAETRRLGGKTVSTMKSYGNDSRYIIVQDPAGAVCALFEGPGNSE